MKKISLIALALGTLGLSSVQATDVSTLTDGLNTFVNDATNSLPFAAAAGLDWSDAYIGSIVAVPPHFGLGVTIGATTIPKDSVAPLISALGGSLTTDLPLPTVAVNGRVGGFLLPFDVGFKVGTLGGPVTVGDYSVSYLNLGVDVRYALFQGEPLLPTVMVGAGVDYFDASMTGTHGSALSFSDGNNTMYASAPEAKLGLKSTVFEAKAQVSKSLLILTPYLGTSLLMGSAESSATVTSTITGNYSGMDIPGISSTGFGTSKQAAAFGVKIYGGTSINLFVLRLDLQGMYSVLDGAYGGSLGTRFQL